MIGRALHFLLNQACNILPPFLANTQSWIVPQLAPEGHGAFAELIITDDGPAGIQNGGVNHHADALLLVIRTNEGRLDAEPLLAFPDHSVSDTIGNGFAVLDGVKSFSAHIAVVKLDRDSGFRAMCHDFLAETILVIVFQQGSLTDADAHHRSAVIGMKRYSAPPSLSPPPQTDSIL